MPDDPESVPPREQLIRKFAQRRLAEEQLYRAQIIGEVSDRAVAWLVEKWGEPAPDCPFCRTNTWIVGDRLLEQRVWGSRGVRPALEVCCENCGYIVHIDAEEAGLVTPKDVEP